MTRQFYAEAHQYQLNAIEFLVQRPHAGLFARPGRGKTAVGLAATSLLRKRGFVNKTLVVAPLRPCYMVWPAEVKEWKEFSHLKVGILHGKNKEDVLWDDKYDLYCINPEGMPWLASMIPQMADWPFEELMLDECSMYKDTTTKRYKLMKPLVPLFKYRRIFTGSPRPNSMVDLFGPMYIMDNGATFGKYITHFRDEFFYQTGYGGYTWELKQGAEKKIYALMAPRVLTIDERNSKLKLPPLTENMVKVKLPAKAQAVYAQMEATFMVAFKAGKVKAANAAVMSSKCRQIASGSVYVEPKLGEKKPQVQDIHDEKDKALLEIIEELNGKPVMVLYAFDHELEGLLKIFGRDTPVMGHGVSMARSLAIEAEWNKGKIPVLLCHPQSMSHGLNLQKTEADVIWRSLTWSYEQFDQTVQRVYRQGQRYPVTVHYIMAEDTLDSVVLKTLRRKARGEADLMQAIGEYWSDKQIKSKVEDLI